MSKTKIIIGLLFTFSLFGCSLFTEKRSEEVVNLIVDGKVQEGFKLAEEYNLKESDAPVNFNELVKYKDLLSLYENKDYKGFISQFQGLEIEKLNKGAKDVLIKCFNHSVEELISKNDNAALNALFGFSEDNKLELLNSKNQKAVEKIVTHYSDEEQIMKTIDRALNAYLDDKYKAAEILSTIDLNYSGKYKDRFQSALELIGYVPKIGMTEEQVRNSLWGEPIDINRTTTSNGVTEQWVYDGFKYVYFEDGIVTAIQD
jgi:hypothetical protein